MVVFSVVVMTTDNKIGGDISLLKIMRTASTIKLRLAGTIGGDGSLGLSGGMAADCCDLQQRLEDSSV